MITVLRPRRLFERGVGRFMPVILPPPSVIRSPTQIRRGLRGGSRLGRNDDAGRQPVAIVSFAGFLRNQLYGAHEAKLSDVAAEVAAII
jgi:hypothetical protein